MLLCISTCSQQNIGSTIGAWGRVIGYPETYTTAAPTAQTSAPATSTYSPTEAPTPKQQSTVFGCNTSHYFLNYNTGDVSPEEIQLLVPTVTSPKGILYGIDIRLWQSQYNAINHRVRTYPSVPLYHWVESVPSAYSENMVVLRSHLCDYVIAVNVTSRTTTVNEQQGYKSQLFRNCNPNAWDLQFNMTCSESAEYNAADVYCVCNTTTTRQSNLGSNGCIPGCEAHGGCIGAYYQIHAAAPTNVPTASSAPTTAIVKSSAPTTAAPTYYNLTNPFSCSTSVSNGADCDYSVIDYRYITQCGVVYNDTGGANWSTNLTFYAYNLIFTQQTGLCTCDDLVTSVNALMGTQPLSGMYYCIEGYLIPGGTDPNIAPGGHIPATCLNIYSENSISSSETVVLATGECVADITEDWCNLGAFWTLTNYLSYDDGSMSRSWDYTAETTETNTAIVNTLLPYLQSSFLQDQIPLPCICNGLRQPYWAKNNELVMVRTSPPTTPSPTSQPTFWPTSASPTITPAPTKAPSSTTSAPTLPSTYPFPPDPTACFGNVQGQGFAYCPTSNAIYCPSMGIYGQYPNCNKNITCSVPVILYTSAELGLGYPGTTALAGTESSWGCGTADQTPYVLSDYGYKGKSQCNIGWGVCRSFSNMELIYTEYCASSTITSCSNYYPCEGSDQILLIENNNQLLYHACTEYVTGAPVGSDGPTGAPSTAAPTSMPTTFAPTKMPTNFFAPWDDTQETMVRNFWDTTQTSAYYWQYTLSGPLLLAYTLSNGTYDNRIDINHGLNPDITDVLVPSANTCGEVAGCSTLSNPYTVLVDNTSDPVYQCLWVVANFLNPPNEGTGPTNIQIFTEFQPIPQLNDGYAVLNSAFISFFLAGITWGPTLMDVSHVVGNSNSTVNNLLEASYWTPWVSITQQYLETHSMDTLSPILNCRGMDFDSCHLQLLWYETFDEWYQSRTTHTQYYINAMNENDWLENFITSNGTVTPMYPDIMISDFNVSSSTFPPGNALLYRAQFFHLYARIIIIRNTNPCLPTYSEQVVVDPVTDTANLVANTIAGAQSDCSYATPCYSIYGYHGGCVNVTTTNRTKCNLVPLCYWCLDSETKSPTFAPVPGDKTLAPTHHVPPNPADRVDTTNLTIIFGVVGVIIAVALLVTVMIVHARNRRNGYSSVNME